MATKKQDSYYKKMLKILGSLTYLFSNSKTPYLNYRITENLFCKAFSANNLARADVSADASLDKVGVGIKTFVNGNGKSLQKIAEFNKDNIQFRGLQHKALVKKVAGLRNKRVKTTKKIYGLDNMIYHCIVRDKGKIRVFECNMDLIDKSSIKILNFTKNTILFKDSLNEYSFNLTKSTLYKRFITKSILFEVNVKILEDPFKVLEEKFLKVKHIYYKKKITENPFVILPLYSPKTKEVQLRSGLNQWNAKGRKRDINEIYIPISAKIHKKFTGFFLPRDKPFKLILPDGKILGAKICQANSKALMSKPNADLGKWLLRKVLELKKGKLLTYAKLQEIGLDSVIIERLDKKTYSIDFMPSGAYEKFVNENF